MTERILYSDGEQMKYKLASLQHFFLNAARWAGQRLPIFISDPQGPPPGGMAAGLKPSLAKNCRRWAKVSRIKADSCDRYNGRDDL
jgi:hypothetical protein